MSQIRIHSIVDLNVCKCKFTSPQALCYRSGNAPKRCVQSQGSVYLPRKRTGDMIQLPLKSRGSISLSEMRAVLGVHVDQTRLKYLPAGFILKVLIRFSFFLCLQLRYPLQKTTCRCLKFELSRACELITVVIHA